MPSRERIVSVPVGRASKLCSQTKSSSDVTNEKVPGGAGARLWWQETRTERRDEKGNDKRDIEGTFQGEGEG